MQKMAPGTQNTNAHFRRMKVAFCISYSITYFSRERMFIDKVDASPTCLPVRPDLAIYWTLGKFLKHLATINLPKSLTFLGNFCKGVKIYHFSSAIIFGQHL